MKNMKIFAIKYKGGKEIQKVEIGTARVNPENVYVSERKFDELKKSASKLMKAPASGECVRIVTEDGKIGQPAPHVISFK